MVIVCALGPSDRRISICQSSIAGYRNSSMIGRKRWISSMNRMSPSRWFVRMPTRSAGFSRIGPDVALKFTPISRASREPKVVLPSPGGPWKRMWSRGSRRCLAAWMAMDRASRTLACPMNSDRR
jgi:hypothetical protein